MSKFNSIACLYAIVATAAGCSTDSGERIVTGAVSYNDAPVDSGAVTFSPIGSGTSFGAKIVSGKYKTEKAYPGEYRVLIVAAQDGSQPRSREEAQRQATSAGTQSPNYIPETAEGNGQTVEIKAGAQTLDFALTGPPRQ